MRKEQLGFGQFSKYLDPPDAIYPIQRRALLWGTIAGLLTGVVLFAPLAGFAVFVLIVSSGALWRRDEPPVLVFCIAYQWLFVAVGYFHELLTGVFPMPQFPVGDLDGATFLSLLGFLAIVLGVRVALRFLEPRLAARRKAQLSATGMYDVRLLFWGVVFLYGVNWFFEIAPREISFNQAQIIYNLLSARDVLLCALYLSIFQWRRGYRYGIAATIFVSLPQSTSQHSAFSVAFIFIGIALLREWRPWSTWKPDLHHNKLIISWSVAIGIALIFMALVWQGGVKASWRAVLKAETNLTSPVDKLTTLAKVVEEVYSTLEWGEAADSLAGRMSGTFYFSHTLNYVPTVAPHENGDLTMRAIEHTLKPRFLFPDKPDLGSNSWLIWQYTGLPAAGAESETSIGLTYMAEFYVDYGRYLMFLPLFAWGLIIGLIYGTFFLLSPSHLLSGAALMVLLPQPFSSYEGEIAYMLGSLIQGAIIIGAALFLLGPWVHRKLLHTKRLSYPLRRQPHIPLVE